MAASRPTKRGRNDLGESFTESENWDYLFDRLDTMNSKLDKLDVIEEKVSSIDDRVTKCESCIDEQNSRYDKITNELKDIRNSLSDITARSMRDNLLFLNIQETRGENPKTVLRNFLRDKLKMGNTDQIQINRCHRIKPKAGPGNKIRTLIAQFLNTEQRDLVLKKAKLLAGTPFVIREQFPAHVEQVRKELYGPLREARDEGHRAFLVVDKLIVNRREYDGVTKHWENETPTFPPKPFEERKKPAAGVGRRRNVQNRPENQNTQPNITRDADPSVQTRSQVETPARDRTEPVRTRSRVDSQAREGTEEMPSTSSAPAPTPTEKQKVKKSTAKSKKGKSKSIPDTPNVTSPQTNNSTPDRNGEGNKRKASTPIQTVVMEMGLGVLDLTATTDGTDNITSVRMQSPQNTPNHVSEAEA